jgi:hypothetical protein
MLPGFDPEGRFVLSKWPQTEREYPRHFRIATAMMKGPSTVAEIAAASSVPAADVIDFINASLATGFAEQSGDGGKSGGLLDRLRGSRCRAGQRPRSAELNPAKASVAAMRQEGGQ